MGSVGSMAMSMFELSSASSIAERICWVLIGSGTEVTFEEAIIIMIMGVERKVSKDE